MAVNEGNIHYVEFRGDTSQLRKEIDLLSARLNTLSKNTSVQTTSIANNTKKMSTSMASSFLSLRNVLAGAGLILGFQQLGGAIKSAFSASAEMENIRTTFRVFTGSVSVANDTLEKLKRTALESPLNFQDFVQGSKTLLGYGVSAQQVVPIISMLGDISGGSADRFQRLSLAFGQVVGAGRLMGQEARQMINAGFNPLQFIAEKTNKTMAELQDEMRKGGISVQQVAEAFVTATSEGGRFYNLSEEVTKTLGGQWNKLKEQLFFVFAEIGDSFVNSFDVTKAINNITSFIKDFSNQIAKYFNEFKKYEALNKTLGLTIEVISNLIMAIPKLIDVIAKNVDWLLKWTGVGYLLNTQLEVSAKLLKAFTGETKSATEELKKFSLIKTEQTQNNLEEVNAKIKEIEDRVKSPFGIKYYDDERNLEELRKTKRTLEAELKTFPTFSITGKGTEDEGTLDKIVNKIKSSLVRARKEVGDAIDAINKPFVDAQKKLDDYISNSLDSLERSLLSKKDQLIYDEDKKYKELINLAKVYGLDIAVVTMAYQQNVNNIEKEFRRQNLENAKKHADSLIGVFQKQVKAQSDLMMKLSGVSAKANLGELIRETDANKFNNYVNSIHSAVSDFYAQTPAMFGQALGEMVAQGADFNQIMDNFGQLLMGQFGKLLQQLGQSLIVLGTSSLVFQKSIEEMFKPGNPAAGVAAVAAGVALVAAGGALSKMSQVTGGQDGGTKSLGGNFSRSRSMTSGNTYQYGGANYATQTINLKVDLTGSITATPSGYSINKSFETGGRVTGRY